MEVDSTAPVNQGKFNAQDLPELLNQYYKRLFPYKLYYKWLSYGNTPKNYFCNREFSFTLKDDIYIRFLSFNDEKELAKEMQKKLPYKIDVGAVYNHKPCNHKTLQADAFKAEQKELVFDIDMTDYDEVRTCCSGAAICKKCWGLMTTALKVIDKALEEDFGFQHRLWVYSGRRGIHCWVADQAARALTQQARSSVAEYLQLVKGGEQTSKKVHFRGNNLHPSISRALKIVRKYFESEFLEQQNIMFTDEQRKDMLKLIPDETARISIEKAWQNCKTDSDKWRTVEAVCNKNFKLKHTTAEIMFQYVYPRLDINVSKGLNHLLKSPFCIHPKTGNVCIPIDPKNAEKFDPFTVPTISRLIHELDEYAKNNPESLNEDKENKTDKTDKQEYMKTSMAHSMKIFEKFLFHLDTENKKRLREANEEKEKSSAQW